MADYKVQPFRQLHEKETTTLYLGVIQAEKLIDGRADIPQFSKADPTGYQRPPSRSRVTSLSRYVQNKGGLLPTAILVNVRQGAVYTDGRDGFGTLHVPDGEPLRVMDGQHRYRGLNEALGEAEDLKYDVPVVFTVGFDVDEEAKVFYTVNHEQRSVSTDLTAQLFARQVAERLQGDAPEKVTPTQLRKLAAQRITDAVRETVGGPWHGRISGGDQLPDTSKQPIRSAVFIGSLQHFLRDRWAAGLIEAGMTKDRDLNVKPIVNVINTYWSALASLMPEAFADHTKYAVQRPLGAYVFNELLPDIVFRADRERDFSEYFFRTELARLDEWVTPDQWLLNGPEPLVSTNSRYAVRYVLTGLRSIYIEMPGPPEAS